MLRAEFALLNDPSRLQELASAHLPGLATLQPGQFTTMADLDRRLPPVGVPPPPPAPAEPAPSILSAAATPRVTPPGAPAADVAAPAPVIMASTRLAGAPSAATTGAAAAPSWATPSTVSTAALAPAAVVAAAAPRPPSPRRAKPVVVASAPQVRRATAAADPFAIPAVAPGFGGRVAAVYAAPPASALPPRAQVGSALGMARGMVSQAGGPAWLPASAPTPR